MPNKPDNQPARVEKDPDAERRTADKNAADEAIREAEERRNDTGQ